MNYRDALKRLLAGTLDAHSVDLFLREARAFNEQRPVKLSLEEYLAHKAGVDTRATDDGPIEDPQAEEAGVYQKLTELATREIDHAETRASELLESQLATEQPKATKKKAKKK